jgi:hypothetical protein
MAVVTSPGGGTSARNKLAGVVFASWRGIQYMRSLRTPQNPRSPFQFMARKRWWCAAMQWRGLLAVQKGYFDILAKLHVPLTNDSGPMPSGVSGTYTGYNLHRFAYMRNIVPEYTGLIYGFLLETEPDRFSFSLRHNAMSLPHEGLARVWYAVKPFGVWQRGTGVLAYVSPDVAKIEVDSPVGIPPDTTGATMMLAFDFTGPALDGWPHVIEGCSMPDGHFAPVPDVEPDFPPSPLRDPCAVVPI